MSTKLPRMAVVAPVPGTLSLTVHWVDGTQATVDMTGAVYRLGAFAPLRDPQAFAQMQVIDNGYAIGWPALDLDYSGSSLARLAEEQAPFTGADFVAWQDRLGLSNQETADFLDASLSTVKNYRTAERIPRPVAVTCRATLRDSHLLAAHFHPRLPGRPRVGA